MSLGLVVLPDVCFCFKEVYADDDDDDTPKKVKRNRKGKTKEAFGVFGCNSCNRTFRSQIAVEVHSMAKHK